MELDPGVMRGSQIAWSLIATGGLVWSVYALIKGDAKGIVELALAFLGIILVLS